MNWMSEKCPIFLPSYSLISKNGFRRDPLAVYGMHAIPSQAHAVTYRCYGYLRVRSSMPCLQWVCIMFSFELRFHLTYQQVMWRLSLAVLTAPHLHAVGRYWLVDLDILYPSTDSESGYVASAFLNFACACNLADSEDEPRCYVLVSIGICKVGIVLEVRMISRLGKRGPRRKAFMHNLVNSLKAVLSLPEGEGFIFHLGQPSHLLD